MQAVSVVYFDQRLGAAYSKRWSKAPFHVSFSSFCKTVMKNWAFVCCIFQPVFGVRSTQKLVEIYNICLPYPHGLVDTKMLV